jgi:hypothetical protein
MPRRSTAQLNIRSEEARNTVARLAAETGLSATSIVEDALRQYSAHLGHQFPVPDTMRLEGPFAVRTATGRRITLAETNRAIEADRMGQMPEA